MSDAEHTIVSGLLQKPSRIADVVALSPEFFVDPEAKKTFALALRYYEKRGRKNAMDMALARSTLERATGPGAPPLLRLVEEYATFAPVTEPEFRDALGTLVVDRQKRLIKDHGSKGLEAVLAGDLGLARQALRAGLLAAEDADPDDDRPADIRGAAEIEAERRALDTEEVVVGGSFDTGFSRLRRAVAFRRRELTIVAGYTADGKTHLAKTIVYNANRAGARVLFVALEMERREMRALFVAHHARAAIDPRGVLWADILTGNASRSDRKLYRKALDDFEVKKDGDRDSEKIVTAQGGALHVWAPRKTINMAQLSDRVRAMSEDEGLDAYVVDYLELVQPGRDLGQYRLNVKDMCEQNKALAREQDVWALVNHQISRQGRDAAEKRDDHPHYLLRDLGESSGVERAADTVLWIYSDEDLKEQNEARIGIAKARKGKVLQKGFHVVADFPHGFMAELDRDARDEQDAAKAEE